MTLLYSDDHPLLQAGRVAARLAESGFRIQEIRIQGRAGPAVQVRPWQRTAPLRGSLYAWGWDATGRFERYAARVDGVQVQWEVRLGGERA